MRAIDVMVRARRGDRTPRYERGRGDQAPESVVGRIDEHDETDRQIRPRSPGSVARTIVDRFREPEHNGQRPGRAFVGSRRLSG
jgi:hypothetical protein